jgi:hypothetical protein
MGLINCFVLTIVNKVEQKENESYRKKGYLKKMLPKCKKNYKLLEKLVATWLPRSGSGWRYWGGTNGAYDGMSSVSEWNKLVYVL